MSEQSGEETMSRGRCRGWGTCLALVGLLVCGSCSTEVYELLGDASRDSARDGPADTGPADAEPDTTRDMRLTPDTNAALPDQNALCVCLFVACRDNSDCQTHVGSNSTCQPATSLCTGVGRNCNSTADCGPPVQQWLCAKSENDRSPCGSGP